jgi:hypothetical protein
MYHDVPINYIFKFSGIRNPAEFPGKALKGQRIRSNERADISMYSQTYL